MLADGALARISECIADNQTKKLPLANPNIFRPKGNFSLLHWSGWFIDGTEVCLVRLFNLSEGTKKPESRDKLVGRGFTAALRVGPKMHPAKNATCRVALRRRLIRHRAN